MKLNKIYISAFGKLKDFSLDLKDGFNVIYGENENGKSTIAAFIKMMFYGSLKATQNLGKSPRKRYSPWDGSVMAGSIDFEHDGRQYRLERTFGSSNSSDKVFLTNLDLGTRSAVSSEPGKDFFSLSMPAFERSVFIETPVFTEKNLEADGEINSKLSNLALSGDEDISFTKVLKRIEDARFKIMGKTGKSGEYAKLTALADEIKISLNTALQKKEQAVKIKEDIDNIANEITHLEEEAGELKKTIDKENDLRNAGKLREMLELKESLDKTNGGLLLSDGSFADEMFVNKLIFCISKLDTTEQKISAAVSECNSLKETIEIAKNSDSAITPEKIEESLKDAQIKLADISKNCKDTEDKLNEQKQIFNSLSKKAFNIPFFVSSLVSLAVFAVLLIMKLKAGYVFSAAALILFLLSFLINPAKQKKSAAEKKISQLNSELADYGTQLNSLKSETEILNSRLITVKGLINSNSAVIEHQQALLNEKNAELESLFSQAEEHKATLLNLYSRYDECSDIEEIKKNLEEMKESSLKQKEIKQQLNYVVKDLGNISYEQAKEKLSSISEDALSQNLDFDFIKKEYELKLSLISDKKSEVAALFENYKSLIKESDNEANLKEQLKITEEKLAKIKDFCDKLSLAGEVLTESFADVRSSYGNILEEKATGIFKGLTGGAYKKLNISKSFELNIEHSEYFGARQAEYLSSGAYDQAYLSLRLALADLITSGGETLPIILDDPFICYDDKRTAIAFDFIKKYSENSQVILFTCHSHDATVAEQVGANIIKFC